MIAYLKDGWYTRTGERRLRDEVVDGAIDTASVLFRSAVPPQALTSLALKVRALATIAEPPHRAGMAAPGGFAPAERQALTRRMQSYTHHFPPLQTFVTDSLEHVHNANELRALYLHLIHVTQMMQLLTVAKLSGAASGILGVARSPRATAAPVPEAAAPAPSPKQKKATKRKVKKKVSRKASTAAPKAKKVGARRSKGKTR